MVSRCDVVVTGDGWRGKEVRYGLVVGCRTTQEEGGVGYGREDNAFYKFVEP